MILDFKQETQEKTKEMADKAEKFIRKTLKEIE